jgi:hypothetical protein
MHAATKIAATIAAWGGHPQSVVRKPKTPPLSNKAKGHGHEGTVFLKLLDVLPVSVVKAQRLFRT